MEPEFEHILLTRFNTEVEYAPAAQRLEDAWLRSRLGPFETTCVPSVRSQRGARFTWVVLLDAASPEWFRQHLEAYRPLLEVVYVSGPLTPPRLAEALRQAGHGRAPWLITTRLDSDDALSRDHLATVQGAFSRQRRTFVEFPLGYQAAHGSFYLTAWRSNPFLSLVERVGPDGSFDAVYCRPHNRVRGAEDVVTLWRWPTWMQSIHDTNNESRLKVCLPRLRDDPPAAFSCVWTTPEPRSRRLVRAVRTLRRRLLILARDLGVPGRGGRAPASQRTR